MLRDQAVAVVFKHHGQVFSAAGPPAAGPIQQHAAGHAAVGIRRLMHAHRTAPTGQNIRFVGRKDLSKNKVVVNVNACYDSIVALESMYAACYRVCNAS